MFKNKIIKLIFCSILLLSCNSSKEEEAIDATIVDVTTELLNFTYIPATSNVPERLTYQVRFTNSNTFGVKGFYKITTKSTTGTETLEVTSFSTDASQCYELNANSSCTYSFDVTGDLNISAPDNIEFVKAVYSIDSTF